MEKKDEELRLLKKDFKLGSVIFSWTGIILVFFVIGILLLLIAMNWFAEWLSGIAAGALVFDLVILVGLINSDMDSTGKITWALVISAIPVLGALFYLYTRLDIGSRKIKKMLSSQTTELREVLKEDSWDLSDLEKEAPQIAGTARYIASTGNFPVYRDTDVRFYALGEYKWKDMLEDLKKAERFIFLEYFIIQEGLMWGKILNILAQKAKEGIEVRVMYDGTCELSTLPHNYPQRLQELGIQCKMFSPLTPVVSTYYNYRDHRKILVIDGKIAYNGGVNLADEYINAYEKYGHWKDTALRLEGAAVRSFTLMFLEMWNLTEQDPVVDPYIQRPVNQPGQTGYVLPYGDNPFDEYKVGETVYMDILYQAHSYVHIMSPYLILDDEMIAALKSTALKGIDVKLILPGVPDKKMVFDIAWTYFRTLMEAGVQIYLYTPGFVHAKVFVSDDCKAVVGTINLDYRSLYHHFECATYMYRTKCIEDIEKDFENTLEMCHLVTMEDVNSLGLLPRFVGRVGRLIAPML